MKTLPLLLIVLSFIINDKTRIIEYNGKEVTTTYDVPEKFIGEYAGRKTGFLQLNADGTGIYKYDVFGFAPSSCKKGEIAIQWGFLIEEDGKIVSFDREYGKSYPILMKSTGETQFQGCRTPVMLDFIMEYKNGQLGVSSSDDWIKN